MITDSLKWRALALAIDLAQTGEKQDADLGAIIAAAVTCSPEDRARLWALAYDVSYGIKAEK